MKGNKTSAILTLFVMILTITAFSGLVSADDFVPDQQNQGPTLPVKVLWVKINGDTVEDNAVISEDIKRGQKIEVSVKVEAFADANDITIDAEISGDEHNDIEDDSETFDVENQTRYTQDLELTLPDDMDQDNYYLTVSVADRHHAPQVYNYRLKIDTQRHAVTIKDMILNPAHEVMAGRALLSTVRVKNVGEKDEDSVKVSVEIPDLNAYVSDYVDDLEAGDSASSEEMYMRIPTNALSGTYEGQVVVEFDDGYKEITETFTIKVVGDNSPVDSGNDNDGNADSGSEAKTQITIGPEVQDTPRGQSGAIYPFTIQNNGAQSASYTVEVTGVESFGTTKVSPSTLVVVNGKDSETVYVYVAASEEASLGQHTFGVAIKSNDETLLTQPMTANVVEPEGKSGAWETVKVALEIGLGVLVIILIILALVVAFRNMKDNEEGPEEDMTAGQTYY